MRRSRWPAEAFASPASSSAWAGRRRSTEPLRPFRRGGHRGKLRSVEPTAGAALRPDRRRHLLALDRPCTWLPEGMGSAAARRPPCVLERHPRVPRAGYRVAIQPCLLTGPHGSPADTQWSRCPRHVRCSATPQHAPQRAGMVSQRPGGARVSSER